MKNDPFLKLEGIAKYYQVGDQRIEALYPINMALYEQDYISITGPSGSGKSTLLSIMGLIDTASEGRYQIKQNDVTKLNQDQLAELRNLHFGFIFQSFHLIDELSVYENVALPLRYRSEKLDETSILKNVEQALAKVEMDHRMKFNPNHLSGGQQQRIAIARALAGSPSVLLVDEPTGNLDSKNGDAIMDILDELNAAGTTICMVTHDARYSVRAKTQYQLFDGGIQEQAPVAVEAF